MQWVHKEDISIHTATVYLSIQQLLEKNGSSFSSSMDSHACLSPDVVHPTRRRLLINVDSGTAVGMDYYYYCANEMDQGEIEPRPPKDAILLFPDLYADGESENIRRTVDLFLRQGYQVMVYIGPGCARSVPIRKATEFSCLVNHTFIVQQVVQHLFENEGTEYANFSSLSILAFHRSSSIILPWLHESHINSIQSTLKRRIDTVIFISPLEHWPEEEEEGEGDGKDMNIHSLPFSQEKEERVVQRRRSFPVAAAAAAAVVATTASAGGRLRRSVSTPIHTSPAQEKRKERFRAQLTYLLEYTKELELEGTWELDLLQSREHCRSGRDIDRIFFAPRLGFESVEAYYEACHPLAWLKKMRHVPIMVVESERCLQSSAFLFRAWQRRKRHVERLSTPPREEEEEESSYCSDSSATSSSLSPSQQQEEEKEEDMEYTPEQRDECLVSLLGPSCVLLMLLENKKRESLVERKRGSGRRPHTTTPPHRHRRRAVESLSTLASRASTGLASASLRTAVAVMKETTAGKRRTVKSRAPRFLAAPPGEPARPFVGQQQLDDTPIELPLLPLFQKQPFPFSLLTAPYYWVHACNMYWSV